MLNPTISRGLTTTFFQEVVRRGHARINPGAPIMDTLVVNRGKNTAYTFRNLLKDADPAARWRLGDDVDLEDVKAVWDDLRAGKQLPNAIKGSSVNGNPTANGNGNTGTPAPASGTSPSGVDALVPPVTPNVHQSAYRVFEKLRTRAIEPPTSVNDAYRLLWDDLDPQVRAGRVSGVLADAMQRLLSEDRVLFNAIFTVLPDEVQVAVEDAILETKADTFYASLGRTVEQVFHIDRAVGGRPGYAKDDFGRWNDQIANHLRYLMVDAPAGAEPTDEQKAEATRIHAMITFRALEEGLRKEVAAQAPAPSADLEPIQFNTVMGVLLAKLPADQFQTVAGAWGVMKPADQHAFMASLEKEAEQVASTEPAAPAPETSTEVVPVEEPATPATTEEPAAETPASGENEQPNRGRRNR